MYKVNQKVILKSTGKQVEIIERSIVYPDKIVRYVVTGGIKVGPNEIKPIDKKVQKNKKTKDSK